MDRLQRYLLLAIVLVSCFDVIGGERATSASVSDIESDQQQVERNTQLRIVGGLKTKRKAYPYFVLGDGCGGSLIWHDIVLSAAHCVGAFKNRGATVGAFSSQGQKFGARKYQVKTEIVHPRYNSNKENGAWYIIVGSEWGVLVCSSADSQKM